MPYYYELRQGLSEGFEPGSGDCGNQEVAGTEENVVAEDSRLRWLCRRGMKELDVIMTRYLDTQYSQASEKEKENFEELLAMPDPDLYSLLLGRQPATASQIEKLAQTLRKMALHA